MSRQIIIGGNWKHSMTEADTVEFCEEMKPLIEQKPTSVKLIIAAPDLCIHILERYFGKDDRIEISVQHFDIGVSPTTGARTGATTLNQIEKSESNIQWVIIGHSEVREYSHIDNRYINQQLLELQESKSGIRPILCIGEDFDIREQGTEVLKDYLKKQLTEGLADISAEFMKKIVIAYEPIWAIGKKTDGSAKESATSDQAQESCNIIRSIIIELYNQELADGITIQYGGSMKAKNAEELLSQTDIDGGLIGGASKEAQSLIDITKAAS